MSENTPYVPPTAFFAWNLAGPVTGFDCGIADMTENPTEGGRIVVPPFQTRPALDRLYVSASGLTASASDIFELPQTQTDLGEWHCEASDDLENGGLGTQDGHGLCLEGKGNMQVATKIGVLEEGGSVNRTYRKPAVRPHESVDTKSKAVGLKADMTPNAHGGDGDQLLHVPSVQQESIVMNMHSVVKGKMEGSMWGRSNSMAQKEEVETFSTKNDKLKANLFYILKRLNEDYKLFLDATPEDFERGTLHVLKCKLCHGANFKTWDHFTRHCKTAELHPLKLFFCTLCGDFFARGDSLERHSNNRVSECRDTSLKEVEAKRHETTIIHREFLNNTKAYLKTNRGTWTPFAGVIKEKYPNSSKKRNKKQAHLQALKSESRSS